MALSRVGHPHPSVTGSRSINCKNGVPQYEIPRRITRIGQVSQIAARSAQLAAVRLAPMLRNRADAALAIADEMDRNELPVQVKHAIQIIIGRITRRSEVPAPGLTHAMEFAPLAVMKNFPSQPIEMTLLTSDYLETTLLFNDGSVDRLADTVSVSPFSEVLLL